MSPTKSKSPSKSTVVLIGPALRQIKPEKLPTPLHLTEHKHDVLVLSAGSSPSALHAAPPINEERPGEYVFADLDQVGVGTCQPSDIAAMLIAYVQGVHDEGQSLRIVTNAGSKILGKDEPEPGFNGYGTIVGYPDAILDKLSEEHGVVHVPKGKPFPKIGELVAIVPNHICPVVNNVAGFVVFDNGTPAAVWPVDARSNPLPNLSIPSL